MAVLINPSSYQAGIPARIHAAAQRDGVKIVLVEARTPREIEKGFALITREKAKAVLVLPHPVFNTPAQLRQIEDLALKKRLPTMHAIQEFAEACGLMRYGSSFGDSFHRAATYVDKIFKGAKPADLPVEQPSKFELFINARTAKVLGITIPQSLLISADKVIE